mgnify:CR=1 FL=1
MAADGSVIIDTRMDTSGVQNGVSAIKQSFNGLGSAVKKIGLLIGGAFAVGKLVQFGKECVELGSDLVEVQNVCQIIAGKSFRFRVEQAEPSALSCQPNLPVRIFEDTYHFIIRKAFRIIFIVQIILPFLLAYIITVSAVCISGQPKVSSEIFFYVIYKPAIQLWYPVKIVRLSIITQQTE